MWCCGYSKEKGSVSCANADACERFEHELAKSFGSRTSYIIWQPDDVQPPGAGILVLVYDNATVQHLRFFGSDVNMWSVTNIYFPAHERLYEQCTDCADQAVALHRNVFSSSTTIYSIAL